MAEHHESPRVDRQLIGRCARQSDPGSCQFFVSADDEIIQRFDPALATRMRKDTNRGTECKNNYEDDIKQLQQKIESISFAARKKMVLHDQWIETAQESLSKMA